MQWSQILFSNPYICKPSRRKPFIFQTLTIGPNIPNSLKYKRSTISACNDIGIRKLKFVFTAQLLYLSVLHIIVKQTGHMQMLLTMKPIPWTYGEFQKTWNTDFFLLAASSKKQALKRDRKRCWLLVVS